jgi:uncharacterized FAD-dependent dehydrogenase
VTSQGRVFALQLADGTEERGRKLLLATGVRDDRIRRDGSVHCSGYEATDVPGVFIAGNIAGDVQLVIFAAAEGAKAAFGINRSLTREQFELNATGRRIVEHPTDEPG